MEKKHIEATTEKKAGKLVAIASTEAEDRSGDSLKMTDWDLSKFKKNPVLQAGHDYRPQYTIGIAKNIRIDGKQLLFEPYFHSETQLARDIKAMYEADPAILKAWSVGFIPYALEGGEKGAKNELLEVSAVAVPANQECLTYAQKSYGEKEANIVSEWVEKTIKTKKEEAKGEEEGEEEVEEIKEEDKKDEEVKEETNEEETNEKVKEEKVEEEKVEEKKVEKKKEEKSPACQMSDETKDECVTRKIPELVDEGMDQEQAVAAAETMCSKKCEETEKESKEDKKKLLADLAEIKEGRVLSGKNKKTIQDSIQILNDAIGALEKLLDLSSKEDEVKTSIPEKAIETNSNKGRKVLKKKQATCLSSDELAIQLLKKINKASSYGLNKFNKKTK